MKLTSIRTLLAFAITSWFGCSTNGCKKTLINGQFDGGKFTIKWPTCVTNLILHLLKWHIDLMLVKMFNFTYSIMQEHLNKFEMNLMIFKNTQY